MKALWAFEPFHQDSTRIKGMFNLLKKFVGSPANIEIGFVVTKSENDLNLAFNIPLEERYTIYPHKCVKKALAKAKVSIKDKNIFIKVHETVSNNKAVDGLLSLAKTRGSKLIGLYTQSRHGLLDFALGSFAETAIHRSKVDLLLVNPKTTFTSKINNILYASDFGPLTKAHLKRVIELCRKTKSKLTVFHAAQVIYGWSLDESNPKVLAYRKKVDRFRDWIEKECKKAKISCRVKISSEFSPAYELTLKAAESNKADLVVVSAKAGPLIALIGGSITRQIIRSSKKPVLVLK